MAMDGRILACPDSSTLKSYVGKTRRRAESPVHGEQRLSVVFAGVVQRIEHGPILRPIAKAPRQINQHSFPQPQIAYQTLLFSQRFHDRADDDRPGGDDIFAVLF